VIAALGYLQAGFSVIPLRHREKRPLIPWAEFQRRRSTEAEVQEWWAANPDAGTGFVCGRVSSLIVLDEDPRNGGDTSLARHLLPSGPVVLTGGGGRHFYFALNGETIPKVNALLPGVDLLGEGALATAPPSIHPSGCPYR
jgi:bifunctional DNA primase/polymerase-like protein